MGAFHGVERGASVVDEILPPPHTQTTAQTSRIVTKIPYHRGRRFQRPRNCGVFLFYLGHSKIWGGGGLKTRIKFYNTMYWATRNLGSE